MKRPTKAMHRKSNSSKEERNGSAEKRRRRKPPEQQGGEISRERKQFNKKTGKGARQRKRRRMKERKTSVHLKARRSGKGNKAEKGRKETMRRVSIVNLCHQWQRNQSNVPFYPNNQPQRDLRRVRRDKDRKERPFGMRRDERSEQNGQQSTTHDWNNVLAI
jgi:hypothetical protein